MSETSPQTISKYPIKTADEFRLDLKHTDFSSPEAFEVFANEALDSIDALESELGTLKFVLNDPQALHLHCLKTLSEGQRKHLYGDEPDSLTAALAEARRVAVDTAKNACHYDYFEHNFVCSCCSEIIIAVNPQVNQHKAGCPVPKALAWATPVIVPDEDGGL